MAQKTHYEVLSVASNCTTDEVRKSYHRLARQHHPDRFRDPGDKRNAEEMFTAMTDAFNVLSDARRRAAYDEELLKASRDKSGESGLQKESKAYAKLAQVKLKEGDAKEAVRLLKAAVHLDPAQGSYYALLAHAHEADGAMGEAARAWDEAIKREVHNASYYRQAGQCLEKARMIIRARKMYEQALQWDRGDAVSAEALRRLAEGGKDDKKAGLLGGFFGKRS